MRLEPLALDPRLAPLVAKAWLFESSHGMPPGDLKTVVPNGLMKFIIPYRGNLQCRRKGQLVRQCREGSVVLVGLQEQPVVIDGEEDGPLGTLGIELQPEAAHRFFRLRLADVRNGVCLAPDAMAWCDPSLAEKIATAPNLAARVAVVEAFLFRLLEVGRESNPMVAWAVSQLRSHHGAMRIDDLSRQLGFSRRYLSLQFAEHVGVSPKTLASIFRFQRVFGELGAARPRTPWPPLALAAYYDQSHFIRDFKRFTGRAPGAYLRQANNFGELFYQR